jgi:hypothetical protein
MPFVTVLVILVWIGVGLIAALGAGASLGVMATPLLFTLTLFLFRNPESAEHDVEASRAAVVMLDPRTSAGCYSCASHEMISSKTKGRLYDEAAQLSLDEQLRSCRHR